MFSAETKKTAEAVSSRVKPEGPGVTQRCDLKGGKTGNRHW